jgi:hypothetical protein
MAEQSNQSEKNSSGRIPPDASELQASQIVGYGIGDVVKLSASTSTDSSSGGTSTGFTPNSTNSPGWLTPGGSEIANSNVDVNSGNSAGILQDSHQATMANAAEGQHFQVSRYDAARGLFWAVKLFEDGTRDSIEVPLDSSENYEVVTGGQHS